MQKAARRRLLLTGRKPDYFAAEAEAEAAVAEAEAAVAEAEAALAAPAAAAAAAPASEAAAAGAGAGAAAGAGAGAGAGSSFLPQAASAAAAIRVASTSDFFISEFLCGRKKQFPEIVRAAGMAALTEQQGLELLLFSPKLYVEKYKARNPRLRCLCRALQAEGMGGKRG
jgi:predicted lipid-binding transport protein (Tim44 family)